MWRRLGPLNALNPDRCVELSLKIGRQVGTSDCVPGVDALGTSEPTAESEALGSSTLGQYQLRARQDDERALQRHFKWSVVGTRDHRLVTSAQRTLRELGHHDLTISDVQYHVRDAVGIRRNKPSLCGPPVDLLHFAIGEILPRQQKRPQALNPGRTSGCRQNKPECAGQECGGYCIGPEPLDAHELDQRSNRGTATGECQQLANRQHQRRLTQSLPHTWVGAGALECDERPGSLTLLHRHSARDPKEHG